jgi:hypothetical protein
MDVSRVVWLEAGLERENVEGGVEEVDWGEWWDVVVGAGNLGRADLRSRSEAIKWASRAMRWIRASCRPRTVVDGPRRGYRHSESSSLPSVWKVGGFYSGGAPRTRAWMTSIFA